MFAAAYGRAVPTAILEVKAHRFLVLALSLGCAGTCFANLGNDDSWFNGPLPAAPPTPKGTLIGSGPAVVNYGPPPPTKEELERMDLAESSDYYVDQGNKWFRQGKWEAAIAYFKKALKENADNDEARADLKKAQQRLLDEQQRMQAEQARQIADAQRQERERAEAQQRLIEQRDKSLLLDRAIHNTQLERLAHEIDHIYVPLPPGPTNVHIHEGVLLGLFNTQEDADAIGTFTSPFTGRPFDKNAVFATAESKSAHEALRGYLDNQIVGEYTLNTAYGKSLIDKLSGTHFDRLLAHSNGATIAEALIKRGVIKVDELNIIGGDRSLVNQWGYQNLVDSGLVKRVVVWINPGDLIPVGSSIAYVAPMGHVNVAPLLTSAEHAANVLSGEHKGGDIKVRFRVLKGSEYVGQDIHLDKTILDPHDFRAAYLTNMAAFFKKGAGDL